MILSRKWPRLIPEIELIKSPYNIMMLVSAFQLAGKLVGVQNLTLEEKREMQIAVTASNSRIVDGKEEEYPQGLFIIFEYECINV